MSRSCVFLKPQDSNEKIINHFKLKRIVKSPRTEIFENEFFRLSVDHSVIRVLFFDKKNKEIIQKVKEYFYGE